MHSSLFWRNEQKKLIMKNTFKKETRQEKTKMILHAPQIIIGKFWMSRFCINQKIRGKKLDCRHENDNVNVFICILVYAIARRSLMALFLFFLPSLFRRMANRSGIHSPDKWIDKEFSYHRFQNTKLSNYFQSH